MQLLLIKKNDIPVLNVDQLLAPEVAERSNKRLGCRTRNVCEVFTGNMNGEMFFVTFLVLTLQGDQRISHALAE